MEKTTLRILDKDEHEQLVKELKAKCISAQNVGFTVLRDNSTLPCIKIDKRFFKKLVQAGSIDVTSRITIYNLYPHLYVKVEISWPAIKQKRSLIFNGWRDREFLEHLCDAKRLALTASGNSIITVDGISTEQLKAMLVITSMMYHPREGNL